MTPPPKSILSKDFQPEFAHAGYNKQIFVPPTSLNFHYSSIYTYDSNIKLKPKSTSLFNVNDNTKNEETQTSHSEVNQGILEYYWEELRKIEKESEKLCKKSHKIDKKAIADFQALLDFEEKHPDIQIVGVKDKKEIPDCFKAQDISMFEHGIGDDKNKTFTGECYSIGYISGLQYLPEDEKKEFYRLFRNAQKSLKKQRELEEQARTLDKEHEKIYALLDTAQSGMLDRVGSSEYEEQVYNQWVNIRDNSNPYYKEIKQLEQERNELWLKYDRTKSIEQQIEQLDLKIMQLQTLSQEWSISNSNQKINPNNEGKLNSSGVVTSSDLYSSDYMSGSGTENTTSAGLNFSNPNLNVSLDIRTLKRNISQTGLQNLRETYTDTYTDSKQVSLNTSYSAGKSFSVSSMTSLDISNEQQIEASFAGPASKTAESETRMLSQNINMTAGNFNGSYSASHTNTQNSSSTYISRNFSYQLGPCNFEISNVYSSDKTNPPAPVIDETPVKRPSLSDMYEFRKNINKSDSQDNQDSAYSSVGFKMTSNIGKYLKTTASVTNSGVESSSDSEAAKRKNDYTVGLKGDFAGMNGDKIISISPTLDFRYSDFGYLPTIMPGLDANISTNIKGTTIGCNLTENCTITINKDNIKPDWNNSTTLSAFVSGKKLSVNGNISISDNSTHTDSNSTEETRIRYGGSINYRENNYNAYLRATYGKHTTQSTAQQNNAEKDIMVIAGINLNLSNYQSKSNMQLNKIKSETSPNEIMAARRNYILQYLKEQHLLREDANDEEVLQIIKSTDNPELSNDELLCQITKSLQEKNLLQNSHDNDTIYIKEHIDSKKKLFRMFP